MSDTEFCKVPATVSQLATALYSYNCIKAKYPNGLEEEQLTPEQLAMLKTAETELHAELDKAGLY